MPDESTSMTPNRVKLLDDPSLYPRIDSTDLRQRLRSFPCQCRSAWDEAFAFDVPRDYASARKVVVLGMGGSAIGGDLLADLASAENRLPISVCRDYQIPSYVDSDTLVLACSYSGETEETISGFQQALSRGSKVIAITRGGTLARRAREHGVPLFTVRYEGEPRSALGYSFITPTALLIKLGLMPDMTTEFQGAIGDLDGFVTELDVESPSQKNPAKALASLLLDRVIVIYGAGIFGAVARRWKTQFNENSKVWAFFEMLPEVHHNSVAGYGLPEEVKSRAFVILLRPGFLHPKTCRGYDVTRELLDKESVAHDTVDSRGDSAIGQMLSGVLLGDYVSYYLALLQGVDPSPVANIDFVKERLAVVE